jgi:hypothetical protein
MPINVNGYSIDSTIAKTFRYKDINTNGLIINLDASALESYPQTGTTWFDISGNQYNATLNNSIGYTSNAGGMITLNGSNQTATINVNSFIRNNAAYTFSTFFYLTTSDGAAPFCLMTTPNNGDTTDGFWQHLNLGNWLWRTEDAVSGEFGGNVEAPAASVGGNYYHIAVVVKTNQLLFYRNGTLLNTISTTFSWANIRNDNSAILFIGKGYEDAYYMTGNVGNFLMYNRQLSSTEIAQIYNIQKQRFGL